MSREPYPTVQMTVHVSSKNVAEYTIKQIQNINTLTETHKYINECNTVVMVYEFEYKDATVIRVEYKGDYLYIKSIAFANESLTDFTNRCSIIQDVMYENVSKFIDTDIISMQVTTEMM